MSKTITVTGPKAPTSMEKFALDELEAAFAKLPAGVKVAPLTIVLGRAESNPEVKKLLDSGFTKPETRKEGYAIRYDKDKRLVLIAGADERGAMYGTMELIHHYLEKIYLGKVEDLDLHEAPAVDYRGIWGWGGQIYNYEQFFDQMARWKMNLCIPWHKKFPANAKAFQDYAASRGVYVAWGYTWGWPNIDWKDDSTVTATSDAAIKTFREQYAALNPWGIYFQSHTEYGGGAAWGAKWVHLVNRTSAAIFETQPDVKIFAGMHGTFRNHDEHVKKLDSRVDMMYEDMACASAYVCGAVRRGGVELNKQLSAVRGEEEKYGYVFKGFTQTMSGGAPQLMDETGLRKMAEIKWRAWYMNERNWRQHFPAWNGILKDMADSQAERKAVTLLAEGSVWGYRPWWAACLLGEAMWNPRRAPEETVSRLEACGYAFSAMENGPEPWPEQQIKHAAVGKEVKTSRPFDSDIGRPGVASLGGPAGLVDGQLAKARTQRDPWWHGVNIKDGGFDVVIDMGEATDIKEISTRFLWAATATPSLFPGSVEYAVSDDGKEFKAVAEIKAEKGTGTSGIKDCRAAGLGARGRYVRVKVTPPVLDPTSRYGKMLLSDRVFIFLDEIVVNPAG